MNINIVKENSTYIATVTFDAQEWKNAQEKAYANLAQNVTVQGFRKGKAPLELAKRHIDGRKMVEKAVDILVPLGNEKVLNDVSTGYFILNSRWKWITVFLRKHLRISNQFSSLPPWY